MKKKEYDVVVIGAGINGLMCAAYLAKTGLSVALLEARHETGGGLDTLEFAGFKYNIHATYHMMAEIMPVYHDFDLKKRGVKYIYPDVQVSYINKDSKPLIFYKNPEKTAQYISKNFSKSDGEKYTKMYNDFKEYSDKILIPCTYVHSVPPIEQVQMLDRAKDDVGRRFNEIAELPPVEILDAYGFSEPIKAGILNLFTMWGLSPFEALGYIFPLYVYRMTNSALCSGGSHRLSSALHKAAIEAGCEIEDKAEVVKVIMSGGRVEGVQLKEGEIIKAKAVASTVDPHQNFLKFFSADQLPENLVTSAKNWVWEKSSLFGTHVSLAAAPRYIGTEGYDDANKAMITFLGIKDTDTIINHMNEVESGKLPKVPHGHTTVSSLFDPIMAPKGYHSGRWESLAPYDYDWDNNAEEYANVCINEWKKYAPNVEPLNKIIYPPTYIEKKIMTMKKGSIKHGAYMPLQMGYFRPNEACSQTWTPIKGFYVCGASVYPGGMIIGGPGYIGANVIAEDFKVKKTWEEPQIVKQAREAGIIVD